MRRPLVVLAALLAGFAAPTHASAATASPCAAFDATTRTDPVLGQGLALSTPYPGNLVPAGQQPRVDLTAAAPLVGEVSYVVTRRSAVVLRSTVPAVGGSLALPKAVPGSYQVEARLTVAGQEVGGTCLRYGIAVPGAKLDLGSALPAGRDWGGPAAERDLALQQALGGSIARRQISFERFLADPASYDETFTAAAARAKAEGLYLTVQVGQGGKAERAAIEDGTWETRVRELVTRHKGVVPYWEAWNEPNFDYFFTGTSTDYVNKVLKPFARAVHAADPAAKVVGGSTYGVARDWWNGFAKAGGFAAADVISFHGYQWDSGWEGTAMVSEVIRLKQLKAKNGAAAKPLWDTESGYRSTSEAGGPWAQADWSVRKLLWERSLGIPSQSFLIEGGWEDWSVIDQVRGVKPAAMALSTMTTLLEGRKFVSTLKVTTKNVYAMRFGATRPGGKGLVAVWTDGRTVKLPLSSARTGWDSMGAPLSTGKTITVGGAVQYLEFKASQAPL